MSRKLGLGSWTLASRALGLSAGFQMLLGLPGEVTAGVPHPCTRPLHRGPLGRSPAAPLSEIGPWVGCSDDAEPSMAPTSFRAKAQFLP